jgi:stage III sporulation protein AA
LERTVKTLSLKFDEATGCLTAALRQSLDLLDESAKKNTWEIRLRIGSPIMLFGSGGLLFVSGSGRLGKLPPGGGRLISRHDMEAVFSKLCDYSIHSHEDDIKNGFVSVEGGHRAGICGAAVINNGLIKGIRSISSINLRVARENPAAASEICGELFPNGLRSVIIAGAPSTGKTTILRDLARRLSSGFTGRAYKVALIDERGELAASRYGRSSFDVGFSDVFTGYPKGEAIISALRSMSPEMIICDEVSHTMEIDAIRQGFNSGVCFAVSVHASDIKDMLKRPAAKELLFSGAFENTVMLSPLGGPCRTEKIYRTDELLNEIRGGGNDFFDVCDVGAENDADSGGKSKTA